MSNYTWADLQPRPRFDGTQPCASIGVEAYFLENGQSHETHRSGDLPVLRDNCAACPFLDPCRNWAIHHEFHGFWGGMTAAERHAYRKQNGVKYFAPEWIEGYYG